MGSTDDDFLIIIGKNILALNMRAQSTIKLDRNFELIKLFIHITRLSIVEHFSGKLKTIFISGKITDQVL